jgi:hypothetical protein
VHARDCSSEPNVSRRRKAQASCAGRRLTRRLSRCMTGADRGGGLPSRRAHDALHPRGQAHRRSDARARPAPLAAAPPLATHVRPPADPAYRHPRASRLGPCRSTRRVIRRRAALADRGVLTLYSTGIDCTSSRQADTFVCVSLEASAPAASHPCSWAERDRRPRRRSGQPGRAPCLRRHRPRQRCAGSRVGGEARPILGA